MKKLPFFSLFFFAVFAFFSCKKEDAGKSPENKSPVADAGAEQRIFWAETTVVHLNGIGTDADGSIIQYRWVKLSGIDYLANKINDPYSAKTYVDNLSPGVHQFQLAVTDDKGATAKDLVTVTVVDTLTVSGKEYLFANRVWEFDENFITVNTIPVLFLSLFYNPNKNMEVSLSTGGSAVWQTVQKYRQGLPSGTFYYSAGGGGLLINIVPASPADNLIGTTASVKVRFL